MNNIIYMNGDLALPFTVKTEFIKGEAKPFSIEEAHIKNEKGYRFNWGTLSQSVASGEIKFIYFGIRWGNQLKSICYRAGMSDLAILDTTMMYLSCSGKSTDVWADDHDLDEYGAFIIDLNGLDGLAEEELRRDVWESYIVKMDLVAHDIIRIANDFKYDSSPLVNKMIDPEDP